MVYYLIITDAGKAPANVPNGMYLRCSHGYELNKTGKNIKNHKFTQII